MKFFRRLDLSSRTRLQMALEMRCRGSGNWGIVSDLAREYGVSRQFLCTAAKSCKLSLPVKGSAVVLMLDEVFANGEPILVVLEASSHCILDIILVPDRKAETWEGEFPSHSGILAAVKFLCKNLPDYWGYFEQLERIIYRQSEAITEHTLLAGCLAWQLEKKAMAVKSPKLKRELSRQSKAQLNLALTGAGEDIKIAIKALFSELDSNVRSSSPLEAINSIIRNYLNACRAQTTQESLTMLAFFLNHRVATRGKYAQAQPPEG